MVLQVLLVVPITLEPTVTNFKTSPQTDQVQVPGTDSENKAPFLTANQNESHKPLTRNLARCYHFTIYVVHIVRDFLQQPDRKSCVQSNPYFMATQQARYGTSIDTI